MGGEPNDFGTPGVGENGFTLWSWEDSVKLRNHIEETVTKASREQDVEKRKAMLTFVLWIWIYWYRNGWGTFRMERSSC